MKWLKLSYMLLPSMQVDDVPSIVMLQNDIVAIWWNEESEHSSRICVQLAARKQCNCNIWGLPGTIMLFLSRTILSLIVCEDIAFRKWYVVFRPVLLILSDNAIACLWKQPRRQLREYVQKCTPKLVKQQNFSKKNAFLTKKKFKKTTKEVSKIS